MTHSMQGGINTIDLKKFGLMAGLILACLFGLLLPWLKHYSFPYWPWLVAVVLILVAVVAPRMLQPVYCTWMRFGEMMNRVTTPVIMGIVYFLIITPMAFVMRARGRNLLGLDYDQTLDTYRVKSRIRTKESMKRPF